MLRRRLLFFQIALLPALLIFVKTQSARASVEGVRSPEPFYAEYKMRDYSPPSPPLSDEAIARNLKRLRRQFIAEGMSETAADRLVKSLEKNMRQPKGGSRELAVYFGAGTGSALYGEHAEGGLPTKYIVKADRELKWDTIRTEKGVSYPILRILPVDPKNPPKKLSLIHI